MNHEELAASSPELGLECRFEHCARKIAKACRISQHGAVGSGNALAAVLRHSCERARP
jgi:hypothetical protein